MDFKGLPNGANFIEIDHCVGVGKLLSLIMCQVNTDVLDILGDMHAHVPHTMNKYNCKTNLEINKQGYMAVKLFICAIVVA